MKFNGKGEVIFTQAEYKKWSDKVIWLHCLQQSGVDNWEGIDKALQLLQKVMADQVNDIREPNDD